jgi:hypothetical protein
MVLVEDEAETSSNDRTTDTVALDFLPNDPLSPAVALALFSMREVEGELSF